MSFFTFSADLPHLLAAVNNVAGLFDKRAGRSGAGFHYDNPGKGGFGTALKPA